MNTSSNTDVTTIYIRNKNNELFQDVKGFEKFLDQIILVKKEKINSQVDLKN